MADSDLNELVTAGFAAMAAHDWAAAREHLASAAEFDPAPSPEVLEGLSASLYLLGFAADARRPMERAFAGFRETGQLRRAIQTATFLVSAMDVLGENAAAQGWEGRARRLLGEVGSCPEEGYLANLANMWIRQGRLDDAEEVTCGSRKRAGGGTGDRPLAVQPPGFWRRCDNDRAGAAGARYDRMRAAPLLALLVQVHLGGGDVAAARRTAEHLTRLSEECSSSEIRAEAHLAAARLALHTGDPAAVEQLETALALLVRQERPHLAAQIRLELARAMATTVESHVNNAMSKLGFKTRTQLARWVEGHVVAAES